MLKINDSKLQSWLEIASDSDFSLYNIPFGIFRLPNQSPRAATRIGNYVVDLEAMARYNFFDGTGIHDFSVFQQSTLNSFIALGRPVWRAVRERIIELFQKDNPILRDEKSKHHEIIFPVDSAEMLLPVHVPDYTDFYSSLEHATNVGTMFRDPDNALLPNWKHLPVGYHGRSSSIVVSGTPIHRPKGQTMPKDAEKPVFGPSRLLDFELEMAFITGKPTQLGESVSVEQAEEHIFGLLLFNDLSARDIQKWEYVPLGPFLGKNFGSPVSPWIVTLDALEPFRTEGPVQEPEVLPYLKFSGKKNYDIQLEVLIQPQGGKAHTVCRSNFKYMYWNMAQQLAHQTINGCNLSIGDMYASGTISGPKSGEFGSLLELSWAGKHQAVTFPDGTGRKFLEDNDTVIMRGFAQHNDIRVGFGEVVTQILPAK